MGYEQRGLGCALDPADIVGVTSVSEEGLAWSQMPRVGWAHQRIGELLRDRRLLIGVGIDYRVPGQRDLRWQRVDRATAGDPAGAAGGRILPRRDRRLLGAIKPECPLPDHNEPLQTRRGER